MAVGRAAFWCLWTQLTLPVAPLRGGFRNLLLDGRTAIGEPGKGGSMKKNCPAGYREVFCRYITRNGKRIYPKTARAFHFYVKA